MDKDRVPGTLTKCTHGRTKSRRGFLRSPVLHLPSDETREVEGAPSLFISFFFRHGFLLFSLFLFVCVFMSRSVRHAARLAYPRGPIRCFRGRRVLLGNVNFLFYFLMHDGFLVVSCRLLSSLFVANQPKPTDSSRIRGEGADGVRRGHRGGGRRRRRRCSRRRARNRRRQEGQLVLEETI